MDLISMTLAYVLVYIVIPWVTCTLAVTLAYGWLIRKWGHYFKAGGFIHRWAMKYADWVDIDVAQKRKKAWDAPESKAAWSSPPRSGNQGSPAR